MRPTLGRLLLFCALSLAVEAQRFVRFISTDGQEYTGDVILPPDTTDASKSTSAKVIQGDILGDFTITNQVKVRTCSRTTSPCVNNDATRLAYQEASVSSSERTGSYCSLCWIQLCCTRCRGRSELFILIASLSLITRTG